METIIIDIKNIYGEDKSLKVQVKYNKVIDFEYYKRKLINIFKIIRKTVHNNCQVH